MPPDRPVPTVVVRPVAPGDLPGLDGLLAGFDEQSRYRRWFTPAIDIHRAAAWAADPGREHAVGLVAVAPAGEIVGHAALVPIDGERAEVCFEVAAPWRHHGIAGALLSALERDAVGRGLRTFVAEVLAENSDMLAVLREHGSCQEHREGSVVELRMTLAAPG